MWGLNGVGDVTNIWTRKKCFQALSDLLFSSLCRALWKAEKVRTVMCFVRRPTAESLNSKLAGRKYSQLYCLLVGVSFTMTDWQLRDKTDDILPHEWIYPTNRCCLCNQSIYLCLVYISKMHKKPHRTSIIFLLRMLSNIYLTWSCSPHITITCKQMFKNRLHWPC